MPENELDSQTQLLPVVRDAESEAPPTPVFVDVSGRRRRLAHRIATGAVLAAGGYLVMLVWSLLGGPVAPDSLMPFPVQHPSAAAVTNVQPPPSHSASGSSGLGTRTAGNGVGSGRSSAAVPSPSASPASSPSAKATSPGRRSTNAPGKPTRTATPGHGH